MKLRHLLGSVALVSGSLGIGAGVVHATPSGCSAAKYTYSMSAYCSGGSGSYRVVGYCTNGSQQTFVAGPWRSPGTTSSIKTCPDFYPYAVSASVAFG